MKNGLVVSKSGNKRYYLDGRYHREDGPAIEYNGGDNVYYLNGKLHRVDGPAVEFIDGDKWYYLNGIKYDYDDWLECLKIDYPEAYIKYMIECL